MLTLALNTSPRIAAACGFQGARETKNQIGAKRSRLIGCHPKVASLKWQPSLQLVLAVRSAGQDSVADFGVLSRNGRRAPSIVCVPRTRPCHAASLWSRAQERMSSTISPCTSVRRMSRPL